MARTRAFDVDEVIYQAMQLFWHKGYHAVSTRELIEKSGISKSSMYETFNTKEDLFIASLMRYCDIVAEETKRKLQTSNDIKNGIKAILTGIVDHALTGNDQNGCFVVNSCTEMAAHNNSVKSIIAVHRKKIEKIFEDAIKRNAASEAFYEDSNAATLASLVCNFISGIQVDVIYIKDKKYFERIIDGFMKLLA